MTITAQQIADGIQGEIIGDGAVELSTISKIDEGQKGAISFLANEKYLTYLTNTLASAVLISRSLLPKEEVSTTLIVVEDAQKSFVDLLEIYNQMNKMPRGIHPDAIIEKSVQTGDHNYIGPSVYIGENAKLGHQCDIYPNVFIGRNVHIGNHVTLEPNVVIFDGCQIGDHVIIHSGSVIGSDGFGFQPDAKGYRKVPQLGNVIIENNVEIGSNCTIDRATMGSTVIKEGAKLDNLIQIAHNVEIGKHTVIASQAGIAGSTKIGEWNMIGGQVGIVGHIKLGNRIKIQAQSGVNKNVPDEAQLYGSPAMNASDFRKSYVYFRNLEKLVKRIEELEKKTQSINQGE